MKKTFTIKHALYLNVIALLTSFAMLLSCTYAWFTDTATSGVNRIEAGRFRVEAYHQTWKTGTPTGDWEDIEGKTNLFKEALNNTTGGNNGTALQLWEPGAMAVESFQIKNAGELALKYQFNLVAAAFNQVKWSQDSTSGQYDLRDVIKVAVVEDASGYTTRDSFINANLQWMTWSDFVSGASMTGALNPNATKEFTVAMYWPSTANDNYYNLYARGLGNATLTNYPALYSSASDRLFIDVKTVINATQDTVEADSFGITYDELAENPNATALSTSAAAAVSASSAPVTTTVDTNNTTTGSNATTLTATVGTTKVAEATVATGTKLTLTDTANSTTYNITSDDTVNLQLSVESTKYVGNLTIATGNGSKSYDVDMTAIVTTTTTNSQTQEEETSQASYKVASTDKVFIVGLYIGTVDLQGFYHNNTGMNAVADAEHVVANGDYYYDVTTGYVTFATTSFSPFTSVYKFAGGLGTEEAPYLIATADQWNGIYAETGYHYYELINDIDFSGKKVASNSSQVFLRFYLNGKGFEVKNVNDFSGYKQLFPYIEDTTIKNLTVNYAVETTRTAAMTYNCRGNCLFENVTTTGSIKTTADWASAYVVYPFDSNNGSLIYRNCINYTNLTTNLTSDSYVAPFGSHTMSIKSMTLENCKNYGTIKGYHVSAFVGMTGGNATRYTVSGLENYGKILYSKEQGAAGLFTFGNHSLNAQVTAQEGSAIELLTPSHSAVIENEKLVIKNTTSGNKYKVSMSISVQMYNYNNSNNWSGGFPRTLTKTYIGNGSDIVTDYVKAPVLECRAERTGYSQGGPSVTYHGIYAPENFERTAENTLLKDDDNVITLNTFGAKPFYYMLDEDWPAWYSLVTTGNGAESGEFHGTITVSFTVEDLDDVTSYATNYSFNIADAAGYFTSNS